MACMKELFTRALEQSDAIGDVASRLHAFCDELRAEGALDMFPHAREIADTLEQLAADLMDPEREGLYV